MLAFTRMFIGFRENEGGGGIPPVLLKNVTSLSHGDSRQELYFEQKSTGQSYSRIPATLIIRPVLPFSAR